MPEIHIDALVYQEDGVFVAHALQLDLVVAGATADEALRDLVDVCQAQIEYAAENDNFDHLFRSAPPEMWGAFFRSQENFSPVTPSAKPSFTSPVSLSAVSAPSMA